MQGMNKMLEPCHSDMLKKSLRTLAPVLLKTLHKGQCGRIAVFGGSVEYTGAPYFAAISALKAGADLSYVVCPQEAASVIKGYSPELIVYPTLNDHAQLSDTLSALSSRLHSVVIGPGFGRSDLSADSFKRVLKHFMSINLPIVIDADGLYFVSEDLHLIRNCKSIVLTPNVVEFQRLFKRAMNEDVKDADDPESVKVLSQKLGGVTVLRKGQKDIISDGERVLYCEADSSGRRCGGQGDLLSGSLATFLYWANLMTSSEKSIKNEGLEKYGATLLASYGACLLTKECNKAAFQKYGRSAITSNMIDEIHVCVKNIFD